MIRNQALVRALEDTVKSQWLSSLSVADAFRIAHAMDEFSRKMSPDAFRTPAGDEWLKDPHILLHRRLRAAFSKVSRPIE